MTAITLRSILLLTCVMGTLCYEKVYPPVNETDSRTDVFIGLMVSFGSRFNSSSNVPGVRVALDMINSDPHLLPGYTLHYVLSDSQCDGTIAVEAFLEQMLNEPKKIALIGAGCSPASEPVAKLTRYFNISQFSCSTASHVLSDGDLYPHYFQLLPTIADTAPVYDAISEAFNWNHIVFIVEDVNLFTVQLTRIKEKLKMRNVSYSVELFDGMEGIGSFKQSPFRNESNRIYAITTYQPHALNLLCEAHRHNIRHPAHVLITYQWYDPMWWREEPTYGNCTIEERESVLNNSLAVNFFVTDLLSGIRETSMGINGSEYLDMAEEAQAEYGTHFTATYCFDAIYSLVYSLNRTLQNYSDSGSPINLSTITYENRSFLEKFLYEANSIESRFNGLTGRVTFDSSGIRSVNQQVVLQYRYNGSVSASLDWFEIGRVYDSSTFLYRNDETISTVWPNGIPSDGIAREVVATIFLPVVILYTSLAGLGIIWTFICLLYNFFMRKKKVVRISSPNLNYFIIVGAFLVYIEVYIHVFPIYDEFSQQVICLVTDWLTAIGYSLSFGPIILKMFRVWYIFRNTGVETKTLHDWKLILVVFAFIAVDLVVLVVELAISSDNVIRIPSREVQETEVDGVPLTFISYICDSTVENIVRIVLFAYKGVLQIAALVLAFLTRKVKIKGLDDSKFIAVIIYITSIVLVVIVICSYTLKTFVNGLAIAVSTGLLVDASCILGLVFIPSMVRYIRDPSGENVFSRSQPTKEVKGSSGSNEVGLRNRIKELENKLNHQSLAAGDR